MQKKSHFSYKSLRIGLSVSYSLMGSFLVQFRTPKGTWRTMDKIGYYHLSRSDPKIYVNSKKLGFWLNEGAFLGLRVQLLLVAFCSDETIHRDGWLGKKAHLAVIPFGDRDIRGALQDKAIQAALRRELLAAETSAKEADEAFFHDSHVLAHIIKPAPLAWDDPGVLRAGRGGSIYFVPVSPKRWFGEGASASGERGKGRALTPPRRRARKPVPGGGSKKGKKS